VDERAQAGSAAANASNVSLTPANGDEAKAREIFEKLINCATE